MDSPVACNVVTRSSSDDGVRSHRGGLSGNVQNISSSLDSWKERRKLKMGARGQLDVLKGRQPDCSSTREGKRPVRYAPLASQEDDDGDTDENEPTPERQGTDESTRSPKVPSTRGNDRSAAISSRAISSSQRSSSGTSSGGVSPQPPPSPSSQLHHLHHEWGEKKKAEESRGSEKGESAAKESPTTTDIRSSQNIVTPNDGSPVVFVPRSGRASAAELASPSSSSPSSPSSPSSSFLQQQQQQQPASPVVSNCSLSPISTRSVSATSTHGYAGSDSDVSRYAGEEDVERCLLSRRKRGTTEVLLGGRDVDDDAQNTDAKKEDCYLVDGRNNSKAIGSARSGEGEEDIDGDDDDTKDNNARDVDVVGRRPDHQQQKNILTQNSEDDEMWNVDFTAIEATETLNNENARQKLLLRRKSSLAQRHRPTRTRKRFSESESESESSNLIVEPDTYEKKKTRDIYYVDLPKTGEYKSSTETSPKIRNVLPEVPPQNVLRERKDPGLQLKKEKDQENRAVLDTTPVVLRKNSYNSFDNTAGSRKPLIREISFEAAKPSNPEKTTPFVNLRRTPRHHEILRGSKGPQSLEDLSDKSDSPQVGSDNYNNRQRNSDLRKETNRNSFPSVDTQPRVLRSLSRVDRRIFEDGPKSTISTADDEWLKKRHSTPPTTSASAPQTESSSPNPDSNGEQKTEKWSVIRQPIDSGTDNKNTPEKPTWLKKNLEPRRTNSYHFTPPAKDSDSNDSQEAPWVKEFRNSRKRVSRIFNNRDPDKPVSDKQSSVESASVRISKPLSSIESPSVRISKPLSSIESPSVRISKPLSSLTTSDQSSRGIVSAKVPVNASPSPAAKKKETPVILPEISVTPKYKVERKPSFNNTNEGGISSSMKENRSPVSRNTINTTEPYLPSWSVADAGEAPASPADSRGELPEWQRKLAEKNKLKKQQSFRRIEDSSSPKAQTEDGTPPKAQPAWRQQLKNRTSSVEQAEKKSADKPDWIKQAEERRARLAKTKLLGGE